VERRGGVLAAMRSWRTASVALLSFSSGLPLGLVLIAIPDWLRSVGVDLRTVGLVTLAQAPWSFKVLWSPFMDRYVPPRLGRRRGWAAIAQVALCALTLALAGVGQHPDAPWIVGALALAVAFAGASQDIAVDAYAVDVLRPEEQGVAVGARIALYRAAMFTSGGLGITLAARWSWPVVDVFLASLYLPMLVVTWRAAEPEVQAAPPTSLREAVWLPFLGLLARRRALEILAFVVLYKLSDNLAGALTRPFLVDMGYGGWDRGVALATVGLAATLGGTFLGGALTTAMGLGHALWAFGVLQTISNVGYVAVAHSAVNRPLMYAAIGFEQLTSGMGTGAFSVLLLRLTQKRFSATQYALLSSLFGIPRILAGPLAGWLASALGWGTFFWISIASGVPGLLLLARFVPLGVREPEFRVEPARRAAPLGTGALVLRGLAGAVAGFVVVLVAAATVAAFERARRDPTTGLALRPAVVALLSPVDAAGWIGLLGLVATAAIVGLFAAAVAAARHGDGSAADG
jgi:PAT family beta-lactamase induction signal transducer AmpG